MSERSASSESPFSRWQGFAPEWHEERGSYVDILVCAPCESVWDVLRKHDHVEGPGENLLSRQVQLPVDEIENALFVYQLKGQEWTQLEGEYLGAVTPDLASFLSERLQTVVFRDQYDDTGGVFGYDIFEDGECVETYIAAEDFGQYDGEEGRTERQRKIDAGWLIDSTNSYEFFSRRGRSLNIESSRQRAELPERVAQDLGMYVLVSAWWAETETRQVKPFAGRTWEDFAAAYLLRIRL